MLFFAVADVFDALVSKLHYKEPMDNETARNEIIRGSGTQFDPKLVQVFLKLMDDGTVDRIRSQSIRVRELEE